VGRSLPVTSHSCVVNMLALSSSTSPLSQARAIVASPSKPSTVRSFAPVGGASKRRRYHQSAASKSRAGASVLHSPRARNTAATVAGSSMESQPASSRGTKSAAVPGNDSRSAQLPCSGLRSPLSFKLEQITVGCPARESVAMPEYL
jgi:hypothetical protein